MDVDYIKRSLGKLRYLDLRIAKTNIENISVQDNQVTSFSSNTGFIAGARALNNNWGISYTSNEKNINDCIKKAVKISKISKKTKIKLAYSNPIEDEYHEKPKINPFEITKKEKLKFLFNCVKKAKSINPLIKTVRVGIGFGEGDNLFINSEESRIKSHRCAGFFGIEVIARKGTNIQMYYDLKRMVGGYELIKNLPDEFIINTCNNAVKMLDAKHAPAGKFPLILDGEIAGIFFHEAVGHLCEADSILRSASVFKDKLNQKVGSELINLYDSPLIKGSVGSYKYDDEGVPAVETYLIKNGLLTGFLHSRETAGEMNKKPTGNGRCDSPASPPIPRMSNTVLKPGNMSFEEMASEINNGIYLKGSMGGTTEPVKGIFNFNAKQGFFIKNGKICDMIKNVCLIGNVFDILTSVIGVGKQEKNKFRGGLCGKEGQFVPVDAEVPHIMLKEGLVGGRAG